MSGQTIDSSALLEAAQHHERQVKVHAEWLRTHKRARNYEYKAVRGQMEDHKRWAKAIRHASNADIELPHGPCIARVMR